MEEVILKDTLNIHWKQTMKSNFGFKMMQKMGWKEDKGLGREENGITNYVKISKRDTGLGLGMDQFQDDNVGSKAWSSTISSYNSVLEVLKATYKPASATSNAGSVSDDSSHDSGKPSKKVKKEKSSKKSKSDDSDEDEVPITPSPIKSIGIKYKKFRESKILANKSFEDKRAIFGHSSFSSGLTPVPSNNSLASMASSVSIASNQAKREAQPSEEVSSETDKEEKKKKAKKEKKMKKEKKSSKKRKRDEKEEE